jgi:hypothetical protein
VRINTALALMKTEALPSITNLQEALSLEQNDQVKPVIEVAINQLKKI